jgi:hypothetical protein
VELSKLQNELPVAVFVGVEEQNRATDVAQSREALRNVLSKLSAIFGSEDCHHHSQVKP